MHQDLAAPRPTITPNWARIVVAASAILGLVLIADQSVKLSSTYDEVTYLRVAAQWWRTGEQDIISRMGTPLTFFKIQQAPTSGCSTGLASAPGSTTRPQIKRSSCQ